MNAGFYENRRVFVTGHTGFKGSWLTQWLLRLGAEVHGYALAPPTSPSLFEQLGLQSRIHHAAGDVRDLPRLRAILRDIQPDVVIHLAAEPLVRASYLQPVSTMTTNVLGTVHLLDALRTLERSCTAVMVTSDKCYENREWVYGYRESDSLGGTDPYSSSKAMAELAVASYRASYFQDATVRVASARAGNVIGGGDWAEDRIVPDCIRALQAEQEIPVRNPRSQRPWQHVLEPIHGYLHLAEELATATGPRVQQLTGAFNFGPAGDASRTVQELVEELLRTIPGQWQEQSEAGAPRETRSLHLSTDKARSLLGWRSCWDFPTSVRATAQWYEAVSRGESPQALTDAQIGQYALTLSQTRKHGDEP